MNSIELIEALVGQTDHDIKEFTGGAVIQTVINNKTIIKYKVSLYFGYENKKPLTRIIEIDKDVYFALPKALDDYLSNVVKRSDSKVFTMSRPTGRPTPNPTGTSTPTNTNTNTLNTKTINTNTNTFDLFWKNYPKKTDKKRAMTSFNRLSKAKQKLATDDCKIRFVDTETKYIPNPTTYLNGERWEDELTTNSVDNTPNWGNAI